MSHANPRLAREAPADGAPWFGTKTLYHVGRQLRTSAHAFDSAVELTASPMFVYGVIRHGARNPGKSTVKRLTLLETWGRLLDGAPDWVARWSNSFAVDTAGHLTPLGQAEMQELGSRLKQDTRLPLQQADINSVLVSYSDKQRTRESAFAFARGLFDGDDMLGHLHTAPAETDWLHRFFDTCDAYVHGVRHNDSRPELTDLQAFQQQWEPVIWEDVLSLLGVTPDAAAVAYQSASGVLGTPSMLDSDGVSHLIAAMWEACSFETADGISSQWCNLFDTESRKIIEFMVDLDTFHTKGPGVALNAAMASQLLGDILARLREAEDGLLERSAVFRVAHAETLVPLYSLLVVPKEARTFSSAHFNTQPVHWRTSAIAPFGANLMLVVFKSELESELQVGMLHNENYVQMVACDTWLCPLSKVIAELEALVVPEYEEMCRVALRGVAEEIVESEL